MTVKAAFSSVLVTLGQERYSVIVRKLPARKQPHVSADSPSYLRPGSPPRVQVLRILREAVDVTDDLTYYTRAAVERAAREKA